MEHQVSVQGFVQCTVAIQELDVLLQLVRTENRRLQGNHNFFLFRTQSIRIRRIDGRQIGILQRIYGSLHFHGAVLKVNFIQKQTLFQMHLRMRLNNLTFDFELTDGNHFVHLRRQVLLNRI